MRYLGIDYGTKRIGTAVSDPNGSFAFAKHVFENDGKMVEKILEIIKTESIGTIVVGDSGDARAFGARLVSLSAIPVEYIGEGWSSFEAARFAPARERHAKGRDDHFHNDAAAAAIILQRYLDRL